MAIQSLEQRKAKSLAYSGEGNPNWGKRGKRNRTSMPVIQLTIHGEIIKHWDSYYDASKEYGTGVAKALLGKTQNNYSNGFMWMYTKDFRWYHWLKHLFAKATRVSTNVVKKEEEKVDKHQPQRVKRKTFVGHQVDQFTYDGKFLKRWPSAMEVTKAIGIPSASISRNIHGHIPHAGGYKFKKVLEEDFDD